MRRRLPATLGIAKTELSIFFGADSTMVTLRGAILAHPHHALHRLVDRAASNLRIGDMAHCLDESHNRAGALTAKSIHSGGPFNRLHRFTLEAYWLSDRSIPGFSMPMGLGYQPAASLVRLLRISNHFLIAHVANQISVVAIPGCCHTLSTKLSTTRHSQALSKWIVSLLPSIPVTLQLPNFR
jgi:hypothetical protein